MHCSVVLESLHTLQVTIVVCPLLALMQDQVLASCLVCQLLIEMIDKMHKGYVSC